MDKILTQEEIDALFSAVKEPKEPKEEAQKEVTPFDFRRPDRIAREQIRAIYLAHDYFARSLSSSLSAFLRAFVEVKLASIEQVPYADFLQSLPEQTYVTSILMNPLNGAAALEINPSLVFPMIDIILGGPGQPLKEQREISEIEQTIAEAVLKILLRDLQEAWKPIIDLRLEIDRAETKPQLLQIVAPGEVVVSVTFNAKLGENVGTINLAIPALMLKLGKQNFSQSWSLRRKAITTADVNKIKALVQKAPVSVRAEIRGTHITVKDIINLEKGDVVRFDNKATDPVFATIGGIPKFTGEIMVFQNKKALKVVSAD